MVDDAHLLPASTLRLIDQRLAAAPEQLQLLLLARYDLPFTRLMPELLGHFAVIRGEALRMDEDEAHTLIAEHARTTQPDVLEAVTRHAQGWSAALVLTARAVATASDPVATARRFATGDASIAARLGNDVFAALQPRERHLLLSIATEERVTTDTAVHLSHDADAAEILAGLEFTGLLVSRLPQGWRPRTEAQELDDSTPWYRIHPLLVEVVRRRLRAGGVDVARAQGTVRRAVRLDIASGHPDMAFTRLVATQQFDEAAMVLGQYGPTMIIGGSRRRDHDLRPQPCRRRRRPSRHLVRAGPGTVAGQRHLRRQSLAGPRDREPRRPGPGERPVRAPCLRPADARQDGLGSPPAQP